jgi:hypothetical protein
MNWVQVNDGRDIDPREVQLKSDLGLIPAFPVHTTDPNKFGACIPSGAEVKIGDHWIHIPTSGLIGNEDHREGMSIKWPLCTKAKQLGPLQGIGVGYDC